MQSKEYPWPKDINHDKEAYNQMKTEEIEVSLVGAEAAEIKTGPPLFGKKQGRKHRGKTAYSKASQS